MPLCELFSRPERIRPMLRLDFLSNDYQDTRSSVEKTTDAIAIEILTGILRSSSSAHDMVSAEHRSERFSRILKASV